MNSEKLQLKNQELGIENLIQPILQKYENLLLTESPLYSQLKDKRDTRWKTRVSLVLKQVKNAKFIFGISKEITNQKNDQRVLEMFSEVDAAYWLLKGAVSRGGYDSIEYIRKISGTKSPDFIACKNSQKHAVEVKMLSPQILEENKFVSKIIDKLSKEAIPQLQAFYSLGGFDKGLILMWSHEPIRLRKIRYSDIKQRMQKFVKKPKFPISIYVTLHTTSEF